MIALNESNRRDIVRVCAISFIIILLTVLTYLFGSALYVVDEIGVLFILLSVYLAFRLDRGVKNNFYSYTNVGYIAGILFLLTLGTDVLYFRFSASEITYKAAFELLKDFPYRFSNIAVPVIFIVCIVLGISNVSLIRHEGFRPKNLLSILLAVFYIGGTAGIYVASDILSRTVFASPSRLFTLLNTFIPMFLLLMMCYFECILAGCVIMGYAAVRKIPAYDKDYIIILGCSIDKRGGLLPLLKGRANKAVHFAWDQEIATSKKCFYIPSGGKGANEVMSEGSAIELYLLSHGAESDEVYPEKESANTYQNMLYSKRIVDKLNPNAKVAFATTNFHVFRSGILARMAGLDAEGIASKTKWYFWPNGFIREFFGILALNKKVHVVVACVMAGLCTALALVAYFADLI